MISDCLIVDFRITGDDCPLSEATRLTGTDVTAQPPQIRDDGNVLLQFSTPSADDFADTLDRDDRIRYLHRSQTVDRDNYRCLSKHPCVIHQLISAGLLVDAIEYRDGEALLTGAVVGRDVLTGVMETAGETVGVRLERICRLHEEDDEPVASRWDLTPAQIESVQCALEMNYFSVPREATATDVADEMGISKSAFLERLRRAQDSLFTDLFS
ncbi:helix-turn-helix domain-containing protein [Natrinema salsiterrestre]|uniref:Helix-turn-helix domain-containing protein n=1 Tax=Natrinema salsiterrestre TaxID=2950540 RepID=A0A9Q4L5U5_9EURY|nr:helix-turn-helix domain-containing protein [Natrinema salsiterrestre]MDF9747087.1 helix-turn-helix domain-containing protein [Natrinema salsiterrestre]